MVSEEHPDDVSEIFTIRKVFQLECAHWLPHVPEGHRCARMHGHSYRIQISVRGRLDPQKGWVRDFADITEAFAPIRGQLDHHCLNDVPGLENPTAERLALWIYRRLENQLPGIVSVEVGETATASVIYTRET